MDTINTTKPERDYSHWAKRFDTVKHITKSSVFGNRKNGTFCGSSAACLGNNYALVDMKVCPECIEAKPRPITVITLEILLDWKKVNYAAKPYLDAMLTLENVRDEYYLDSADSILRYFLSNAGTWKGEVARRVKLELKSMLSE